MTAAPVGLLDDEVRVVGYDDAWPAAFDEIRARVRPAVPCARVEHIGSTSVPGLAAKPLIDVSVGLCPGASLDLAPATASGLVFRAVNPESVVFAIYDVPELRIANVHVRYAGSAGERWDLLVRDYLREHEDAALRYAAIKRDCARAVDGRGRAEYSARKSTFFATAGSEIEHWATSSGWSLPDELRGDTGRRGA